MLAPHGHFRAALAAEAAAIRHGLHAACRLSFPTSTQLHTAQGCAGFARAAACSLFRSIFPHEWQILRPGLYRSDSAHTGSLHFEHGAPGFHGFLICSLSFSGRRHWHGLLLKLPVGHLSFSRGDRQRITRVILV
jgi:hypothetical protein